MDDITLHKVNDVYLQVECNDSIAYELSDYFSFYAKNYQHMPKYKAGMWDGRIRLFSIKDNTLYYGLLEKLAYFAKTREYTIGMSVDFKRNFEANTTKIAFDVNSYNPPFTPYDYQKTSINLILNKKRRLIVSPTSSGKSFIIYGSMRYLVEQGKQVLLVVPTTSLVEQMVKDFKGYGWDVDEYCHKIYSGKEKLSDKPVIVTTWQSIYKLGKKWFSRFDVCYVDEAHLATADSIKGIMEKLENCPYRIGLTGTVEDTQTHKLVLQGVFGKVHNTVSTKKLMDAGVVAKLKINAISLKHNDEDCKIVSKMKYSDEIKTIINDGKRNKFICNLAQKQKGNTLVLFNFVEKHGLPLYQTLSEMNQGDEDKLVFFVHGNTPTDKREEIREIAENNNNVIIVASYGTFSTGINIKNLDSVIFAHPYKSKIKNLQSIGRVLRKASKDAKATLFDIVDNYGWKKKRNTTYKHFLDRLSIYEKEQFEYKIIELNL